MDSGQPPPPPPPPPERLRPTLQLKIKATLGVNSGQPPPPPKRLRPTLELKIKANSWNEFRPTPPLERLRPTLQLKIKANSWNKGSAENSHELTWRRLFSFQLILVSPFLGQGEVNHPKLFENDMFLVYLHRLLWRIIYNKVGGNWHRMLCETLYEV